ncbi:hypothetical protein PWT90_07469 [Aphanocladium album]|nr:hypothetical protein PWT90_07469 [Aphanocladium album]
MSSSITERRVEAIGSGPTDLPLSTLPQSPRSEAWNITEDGFWRENDTRRQAECAEFSQRWRERKQSAIAFIHKLESEARQLHVEEYQLEKQLMVVHSQAALVNELQSNEKHRLDGMDLQQNREEQELLKNHERTEFQMQNWFRHYRNNNGVQERQCNVLELIDKRPAERQRQPPKLPSLATLGLSGQQPTYENQIVHITDAGYTKWDKLQYPSVSNERTTAISARAVRQVIIFQVLDCFEDIRPKIYNFDDGKATCWIACMIQATGIVQMNKCQACHTGENPFGDCIVVGGHLFPKCGNCEWNGLNCCGLAPISPYDKSIVAQTPSSLTHLRRGSQPLPCAFPMSTGRSLDSPVNVAFTEMQVLVPGAKEAVAFGAASYRPSLTSTSGFKAINETPGCEPAFPATPSNVTSPVPSGTNNYQPTPPTIGPMNSNGSSMSETVKENLIIQHNGKVYTFPECIENVPVEKIYPGHPYWENWWPDLQQESVPVRNPKEGQVIHNFLEQGAIHPFQLLSRSCMHDYIWNGSICSASVLFRLAETLNELKEYGINNPVYWLRQRLHELIEEQGDRFKLSRTLRKFYHDPKLEALRVGSGVKNLGRRLGKNLKNPDPRTGNTQNPSAESVDQRPSTTDVEERNPKRQRTATRTQDGLENLGSQRAEDIMSDRQIFFEGDEPRGGVMVAFKREIKIQGFIDFCGQEEIELAEETWKNMEDR